MVSLFSPDTCEAPTFLDCSDKTNGMQSTLIRLLGNLSFHRTGNTVAETMWHVRGMSEPSVPPQYSAYPDI